MSRDNQDHLPQDGTSHSVGSSVHRSVEAFDVSVPASKLFYTENEQDRDYASADSEKDQEWKGESSLRLTDLEDTEGVDEGTVETHDIERPKFSQMKALKSGKSDPHLGSTRPSGVDLGEVTASEPMVSVLRQQAAADRDRTVHFSSDVTQREGYRSRDVRDVTNERISHSEGAVTRQRPAGRGRLREFGRSIVNVLSRTFRRHPRRRDTKRGPPSSNDERDSEKRDIPTQVEELRLPADQLIQKEFRSKRVANINDEVKVEEIPYINLSCI
ncbi:uncharacterized protein LOC124112215 isoform X1 [Haliotis rufescens]|uniref:uncharacterized protein LOC124112215 isoform X1 n=1 Tax=Haliotis rufescens TaxID=6454 RepID=UPI00201F38B4|nr:uncharacterized protein LOC124112215 isoform X1 [Haliotis rufescens]XP_048240627.1 uncharacterized protein LOC124112215 isoform X1 [Haliotis rufescens]XP_048240628.1 uncharacterized protein LOC124112215 isoform X1 [Haliotis rufescens]